MGGGGVHSPMSTLVVGQGLGIGDKMVQVGAAHKGEEDESVLQVRAPGLGGGGMRAPSFKSKQPPALALDLIKARPRDSSLEDLAAQDGETDLSVSVQLSVTADQDSLVSVGGWVGVFLCVST